MDMSGMQGLAARLRKRAGKGAKRAHTAPGELDAHGREASGVGRIAETKAPRQAEAEAVARAVLDALSSHDPL